MKGFKALLPAALAALLSACGSSGADTPAYTLTPLQPLPGVSDWSMSGGGPSHSGYVPVTLDAANFSLRWSAVIPKGNLDLCDDAGGFSDCVFVYPAVTDSADGQVIVLTDSSFGSSNIADADLRLTSLNEQDGSEAWSQDFPLSDDPELQPFFSFAPPSAFGGKVYFSYGVQDNRSSPPPLLDAFDAKTGTKVFTVKSASAGITQSVVADSTLYAGLPLSAYDAATGALRWTSAEGGSDPTVTAGAVYLSRADGATPGAAFVAVNPASGARLFQINGAGEFATLTAPLLDGMGGAVVGRLGTPSGSFKDVIPAQGFLDHYRLATRVRDWTVSGDFSTILQPVVGQGLVYACDGNAVTAYAVSDGTKQWSWTGDSSLQDDGSGNSNCSLLLTQNLLFVSSSQVTTALDLSTHAPVWSWQEGGKLSLSPSGLLYIGVVKPAPAHLVAINLH